jgi:hypothetical protein
LAPIARTVSERTLKVRRSPVRPPGSEIRGRSRWLAVRLRKMGRWAKSFWVSLPAVAKISVVLFCVAALGYTAHT